MAGVTERLGAARLDLASATARLVKATEADQQAVLEEVARKEAVVAEAAAALKLVTKARDDQSSGGRYRCRHHPAPQHTIPHRMWPSIGWLMFLKRQAFMTLVALHDADAAVTHRLLDVLSPV